jgi:hypothetical protein
LKLEYDDQLSNFAFKFNLRCYNKDADERRSGESTGESRAAAAAAAAQTLAEAAVDAEEVSINGFIAGLRTHLPAPGRAGGGSGVGGGTAACSQVRPGRSQGFRVYP